MLDGNFIMMLKFISALGKPRFKEETGRGNRKRPHTIKGYGRKRSCLNN